MNSVQEWKEYAESDLAKADAAYSNGYYDDALYHLQQADEKAAKALLYKIGLLLGQDEEEAQAILNSVFGIDETKPEKYGHNWHPKLLQVLGEFLEGMDELIPQIIGLGVPEKPLKDFREMFPNFRNRLQIASKIVNNPNPKQSELSAVITDANKILDSVRTSEEKWEEAVRNAPLPSFETFDPLIKSVEQLLGERLSEEQLADLKSKYGNAKGPASRGIVALSECLLLLAVLSTFLAPHESLSRYPRENGKFEYNAQMPLIVHFKEVRALITRCIEVGTSS